VPSSPSWAALVPPGSSLVSGHALGEPTALLEILFDELRRVPDLTLTVGMSLTDVLCRAPDSLRLQTFLALGSNTRLVADGRMQVLPMHLADVPRAIERGPLRPQVALVLVSPPDDEGLCFLGTGADHIATAAAAADVVLAEINPNVPRIAGDTAIPMGSIDAWVRSDRPLPEVPRARLTPEAHAAGRAAAAFVRDGDCIQVGVGRAPEAVLAALTDRRDLGIHSGVLSDALMDLVERGAATNRRKRQDRGLLVAGTVLSSADGLRRIAADPMVRLRSTAYLSQTAGLERLVSINSALQVDLLGQVNAEVVDGRRLGSTGGQVDYVRAAAATGGRSIIILPATAGDGSISRVVERVEHVTTLQSDVDLIVTEHGVAELGGLAVDARVGRMLAIAAPGHRAALAASARRLGL
jgi:acyl-CoA hydrolase